MLADRLNIYRRNQNLKVRIDGCKMQKVLNCSKESIEIKKMCFNSMVLKLLTLELLEDYTPD